MARSEQGWQTAKPTIKERSKFMCNNELLSDVKFLVRSSTDKFNETKVIPAHKFVLSISSPVFLAMFYGEMAETGDSVELPDCEYDGLLELFRYMYSDEVNLTGNNVMQVLYLATKYIVPALVDKCIEFLQENLDACNVFCILPHAQKFQEKDLLDKCWEVIDKNTEDALKSDEFVTLERSLVETVVKRDSLNVKEIELFKAVDRWAIRETERQDSPPDGSVKRRIVGEEIVKAIRFPLMSQREFASVVPDCNILTIKEIVDLIKHYSGVLTYPLQFIQAPRSGTSKHSKRRRKYGTSGVRPPGENNLVGIISLVAA